MSLVALLALVASAASGASGRPRIALDRGAAAAGDPVTARVTSAFAPMRLYLVPRRIAPRVRSRFDSRIHFVAEPRPDARGLFVSTFAVPPLESGVYAVAVYCPGCRPTFLVPRRSPLRVTMPAATTNACPTTRPNRPRRRYGNGLLSIRPPSRGVLRSRAEPNGSLFNKIWWVPARGSEAQGWLTVSGHRLDAPSPPLRLLDVNWGGAGSWASALEFPSAGCWKVTGRVADVKLSYVVELVPG